MRPSQFQIDSIKFVLQSGEFSHFLEQLDGLNLKSIEHTGVGCIYSYYLDPMFDSSLKLHDENDLIVEGGFFLRSDDLPNGASLTLWIEKGRIASLEVLANGSDFPLTDPTNYSFDIIPINIIKNGQQD
jgi:hypothetical protein